jgi:hypothetical protein
MKWSFHAVINTHHNAIIRIFVEQKGKGDRDRVKQAALEMHADDHPMTHAVQFI